MALASESGHFYLPSGEPFYAVPNKSRPGEFRDATVRDAIKVMAEPSVTSVLKAAAAPQLTNWLINQALDAALTLPRLPDESLEDFKARALADSQEQAKKARDSGTAIHEAIERHIKGEVYDLAYEPHVNGVKDALRAAGIDLHEGTAERSFCLPSQFGGKIDASSDKWVIDFKGTDEKKFSSGKTLAYNEHLWQNVAYAYGLGIYPYARCLNVFISRETGKAIVHEWSKEDQRIGLEQFKALLRFYRLCKGFDKV